MAPTLEIISSERSKFFPGWRVIMVSTFTKETVPCVSAYSLPV
jgi:hypothetical protein